MPNPRGRLARILLACAAAPVLVSGAASTAYAEPRGDQGAVSTPSAGEVAAARGAAGRQARLVDAVRAQLDAANERLRTTSIAAAKAAETYNGARYRLRLVRRDAAAAQRAAQAARADVRRQRDAYEDALAQSYALAPELTALSAIADADGIDLVVERTATLGHAEAALADRYDEFRGATATAAGAARAAERSRARAARLATEARRAHRVASRTAAAAATVAADIAAEKRGLLAELAVLQDVSVRMATRRQAALEQEALDEAAAGEAAEAPAAGAAAAIAFASAQLGEPYVWAADGPGAWDCSGLTMGAWGAGGISLPHYSVAQYDASTPIGPGALRPGDLLFWGSSSRPSSIYHVALYVGAGQMIHAPRTGRPVTRESMYSWMAPTFHARPS